MDEPEIKTKELGRAFEWGASTKHPKHINSCKQAACALARMFKHCLVFSVECMLYSFRVLAIWLGDDDDLPVAHLDLSYPLIIPISSAILILMFFPVGVERVV